MLAEGADAPLEGVNTPEEGADAAVEGVNDTVECVYAPVECGDTPIPDKLERLLRDEGHKIVLTIPLESFHSNRSRHLVIVSAPTTKLIEDLR